MDENLINELIEQLEQNLKNVESARQQVEKTVQAYDVLRIDVGRYTTELSFITQNVRTMISQLEEMKERFLGNISKRIVDEIRLAVTTITTAINSVSSQLSSLYDLTESKSEQIIDTITSRADFVDSTLRTVRTELSAIDEKVVSCNNQLGQLAILVNSLKVEEKEHYDSIVNLMEEQENRLKAELDVVRKHNIVFSIIIIILLITVIGFLFYFNK